MTVLLTGFEPFGGDDINPSWEAVRPLDGVMIAASRIVARCLPCVFDTAGRALEDIISEVRPSVWIGTGLARGRQGISVERVAVNLIDAPQPDNAGAQPLDCACDPDGPAAYFATLPVKAIVAWLRRANIPASLSQSAGTYVCNHVFYAARHMAATRFPGMRAGFIHVPCAREQAGASYPGMAIPVMTEALRLAVEATLTHAADLAGDGGATH